VHQTRLDGLNLVDLLALQVILQEVDAVAHNQWNVHAVVAAGPLGGQADGNPKHGISEGQHLLRGGGLVLLLRQLLALLVLFVLLVGLFVFFLVLALVLLVLLLRLVAFLVFVLLAVLGLAGRAGFIVCVFGISFGFVAGLFALLLALGASKLECLGLLRLGGTSWDTKEVITCAWIRLGWSFAHSLGVQLLLRRALALQGGVSPVLALLLLVLAPADQQVLLAGLVIFADCEGKVDSLIFPHFHAHAC